MTCDCHEEVREMPIELRTEVNCQQDASKWINMDFATKGDLMSPSDMALDHIRKR